MHLHLNQFQFLPFPLFVALGNCPFKIGNDYRERLKCAVRLLALRFMIFPTLRQSWLTQTVHPTVSCVCFHQGVDAQSYNAGLTEKLICPCCHRVLNDSVTLHAIYCWGFLHCRYWVLVSCLCTSAVAQHFAPCGIIKISSRDIIKNIYILTWWVYRYKS